MAKLTPVRAIRQNVLTVAMDRVQELGYVLVKHARYTATEWDIDLEGEQFTTETYIEKKNPTRSLGIIVTERK
ncbi:MAG: hypothetical protein ACLRH0_05340 [Blautia wexlerae]